MDIILYAGLATVAIFSLSYCVFIIFNDGEPVRFIVSCAVCVVSLFMVTPYFTSKTDGNIEKGKQISTECKLIEINVADDTSRFSCKDITLVVKTSDAKRFVEAYKKSITD